MAAAALRAVVCALALLALLRADPAGGQEDVSLVLSFPPDFTLVATPDLPVEGHVLTPGVDEVGIVLNDGRPVRAFLRDGVFAEELWLEKGPNVIRVGDEVRRVWYAAGGAKPPPNYRPVYGHFGLNDACLECHKRDSTQGFALSGDPEEICLWCHADLTLGRLGVPWASVHASVRAGKCLSCHTPHTAPQKGLLTTPPPDCSSCHAAIAERLKTDRFIHGPMSLGDCRICHAVHASAEPRLLLRPLTQLCTGCHGEALPPADALPPHPMVRAGACGRCHEPHSSQNQHLLRQAPALLCQGCHQGKTRSFHESKGFSIYVCAKCHELHRPAQPHLLLDSSSSLCTTCHAFADEKVFRHSLVSEGKCFVCHSFHMASLGGDIVTTCLKCHGDNPNLAAVHRRQPIERSVCTGCHLPHQARRGKLLRSEEHTPFARRECASCHKARARLIGKVYRPLCLDCHRALNLDALPEPPAVTHPPFRDEDCSRCHTSHNAETPGVLRAPQSELCLECHRKLRKSTLLTPTSAHTAFTEGGCTSCHAPHFSANPALLRRPPRELCSSCHAALLRAPGGGAWPVPHRQVDEVNCSLCHRGHSSTFAKLLKAASPQPCRPCHVEFMAGIEAPGMLSRHAPVKSGACGTCHDLHGGAAAGLLKPGARTQICRSCHPQQQGSHHLFTPQDLAAKDGGAQVSLRGCTHCHPPHAAPEKRLLLPMGDRVCQGCHKH